MKNNLFYLFWSRNFSVFFHTPFGQYKSLVKLHTLRLITELMSLSYIKRCSLSAVYKDLHRDEDLRNRIFCHFASLDIFYRFLGLSKSTFVEAAFSLF